jgi:hypothetical protein
VLSNITPDDDTLTLGLSIAHYVISLCSRQVRAGSFFLDGFTEFPKPHRFFPASDQFTDKLSALRLCSSAIRRSSSSLFRSSSTRNNLIPGQKRL